MGAFQVSYGTQVLHGDVLMLVVLSKLPELSDDSL